MGRLKSYESGADLGQTLQEKRFSHKLLRRRNTAQMEQKNLLDNTGQQLINTGDTDSYVQILIYYIQDFLTWWYVRIPIRHLKVLGRLSVIVDDNLSITLLFKNFFVPWHRDRTIIGFFFGILIKLLYLPIALAIYLSIMLIYVLFILIWLILPVATIVFIIISTFQKWQ